MRKIILASNSDGRKEVMGKLGIKFEIESSNYKEDMNQNVSPKKLVRFLSKGKAEAVAKNHKNAIVIGADTVIVLGKEIFGKPKNSAEAKKMLKKLSGKQNSFISGFTIIDTKSKKIVSGVSESKMFFRKIKDKEIDHYIRTGQGMDKAGAYGVPGLGVLFVKKMSGDFCGAMGLSIYQLGKALKKLGVDFLN